MKRTCCIKGCDRPFYGHHFCTLHYDRWRANGHPLELRIIATGNPIERFWHYTQKTETCWLWTGRKDDDGYGNMYAYGRNHRAHRFSYELHRRPIPAGMVVRHTCDVPACVNPEHLLLGTTQDNTRDRDVRGRGVRGTRSPHSKLTDEQVAEIRRRYAAGESQDALATIFGIGQVTVSRMVLGKTYKKV